MFFLDSSIVFWVLPAVYLEWNHKSEAEYVYSDDMLIPDGSVPIYPYSVCMQVSSATSFCSHHTAIVQLRPLYL